MTSFPPTLPFSILTHSLCPFLSFLPSRPPSPPPHRGDLQSKGEVFKIQSFEMGVLFLHSRYTRFARTFSLTPFHPLLGLGAPAQENITGFYSASCEEARNGGGEEGKEGLLAFPIPYECPPPRYGSGDVPWVSPLY